MKVIDAIWASVGAVAVMTVAVSAQAPADPGPAPAGQSPAPAVQSPAPEAQSPAPTAQSPAPATSQQEERVTVVGCVMRESDYRKAADAGKGGVAGTGLGAGDEFVLTNASPASAAASAAASNAPGRSQEGAVGTSGAVGFAAYELTGSNEKQAEQFVGKRVEISGTLKRAEMGAAGPTGGATARKPPSGVDVGGKDLKLREIEVASVKEAEGTCPTR